MSRREVHIDPRQDRGLSGFEVAVLLDFGALVCWPLMWTRVGSTVWQRSGRDWNAFIDMAVASVTVVGHGTVSAGGTAT